MSRCTAALGRAWPPPRVQEESRCDLLKIIIRVTRPRRAPWPRAAPCPLGRAGP